MGCEPSAAIKHNKQIPISNVQPINKHIHPTSLPTSLDKIAYGSRLIQHDLAQIDRYDVVIH